MDLNVEIKREDNALKKEIGFYTRRPVVELLGSCAQRRSEKDNTA